MSDFPAAKTAQLAERLARQGYWPAKAEGCLRSGKYSTAVEICREHLDEQPDVLSGRLIYAIALHLAWQTESATEQFYRVLSCDPDNMVALKYLGDIEFAAGNETAALSNYRRVLEIDPFCRGLVSEVKQDRPARTRTISIIRGDEDAGELLPRPPRELPFYTETIGDLFLAQGYPRLAADVYRTISKNSESPRLLTKLRQAEDKMRLKET